MNSMSSSEHQQVSRCECHNCTQARYRGSFQWQIEQALNRPVTPVTQAAPVSPRQDVYKFWDKWSDDNQHLWERYSPDEWTVIARKFAEDYAASGVPPKHDYCEWCHEPVTGSVHYEMVSGKKRCCRCMERMRNPPEIGGPAQAAEGVTLTPSSKEKK